MTLAYLVERYRSVAGEFGRDVRLSNLGFPKLELQQALSAWNDDYQISRYITLTYRAVDSLDEVPGEAAFSVGGEYATHMSLHPGIAKAL